VHPLQPIGAWAPVRAMLPRSIRNANAELLALRAELLALQPRLARITAPVLIVHGGADTLVPVENVPYMQRHLNGTAVQTRVLAGRNHFLPWNAAQEVHDAIAWGVATAVRAES
jgi:pimeloyl-ACP methyl ester carboxylesterase